MLDASVAVAWFVRKQATAYDASYLDLALSLRLPLACRDGPLQRALSSAGVRLA